MTIIERAADQLKKDGSLGKEEEGIFADGNENIFSQNPFDKIEQPSLGPTESSSTPGSATGEPSFNTSAYCEIDLEYLASQGILTPDSEDRTLIDNFRSIKRPILDNALGKGASRVTHPNLIMVTSSLPGEGKTFTSVNLAISIASEMDKTVLLIDADVAKPSINTVLGISSEQGLIDVLNEDVTDLSDVLLETNIPKLRILPAGPRHRYSTELLASKAMELLADDLSRRYSDRIIIFDSPPLLITPEARVLTKFMGQVLLVVEAENTLETAVRDSLSLLEDNEIVGLVLNKSHANLNASYGHYGHYGHNDE